jgi:hypothetical protein
MRRGTDKGAVVPTARFWELARVWYQGRLDLDWSPRSRGEAQSLLESADLTGQFWALG